MANEAKSSGGGVGSPVGSRPVHTSIGILNARSIPTSNDDIPTSGEIARKGVIGEFDRQYGVVMRGRDGMVYHAKGKSVIPVGRDVKPARTPRGYKLGKFDKLL